MTFYERVIRWGHRAYKLTLSPWIGRQCRFLPTCSDYAAEALIAHGPARGGRLAVQRLLRCHPWGGSGLDPVPQAPRRGAESDKDDRPEVPRRPGPPVSRWRQRP